MSKLRAQASFFDGIMFMLLVLFSISLVFISFNNYSIAQDKVLRTAYLSNYLQSSAKALYYIDAASLSEVKSYCNDPELSAPNPGRPGIYYCKGQYSMDCLGLNKYKGRISVADLMKKDLDPSDTNAAVPGFDDKYGKSEQMGLTALRCAMKEILKPFTYSGYKYISEVAISGTGHLGDDQVVYAKDQLYASDFMYTKRYQDLDADTKNNFGCVVISINAAVQSDQLLVIRTPFKVLVKTDGSSGSSFGASDFVLRTCLWPTKDVQT